MGKKRQRHNSPDTMLRQCRLYHTQGNLNGALQLIQRLLGQAPKEPRVHLLAATLFLDKGKPGTARRHFDTARQLRNTNDDNQALLHGRLLEAEGDSESALACYRALQESTPPRAGLELARLLAGEAQWEEAAEIFTTLFTSEISPEDTEPTLDDWLLWSRAWVACGRLEKGVEALQQTIQRFPSSNRPVKALIHTLHQERKLRRDAIQRLENLLEENPQRADIWRALAEVRTEEGAWPEAGDAWERSLALEPDNAHAHHQRGVIHAFCGEKSRARTAFQQALELDPELAAAHLSLAENRRHTADDTAHAEGVEHLLAREDLDDRSRTTLLYALAKIRDDQQHHTDAFRLYEEANRLQGERWGYDPAENDDWSRRILDTFAVDGPGWRHIRGSESEQPVLIVGLPRSGTTLVEQIVASHPQAFGAGELSRLDKLAAASLPFHLKSLDSYPELMARLDDTTATALADDYLATLAHASGGGDYSRICDKMPSNFFHLGLFFQLFPNGRVIHCRRDARDTALSITFRCFRNRLDYSTSLRGIRRFHAIYRTLMRHWIQVLGSERILTVDYEQLTREPESGIRRVIDFLDLPWREECLQFHTNNRPTPTSISEVRQPVYRRSVERWKRYQSVLPGWFTEAWGAWPPQP
ncbi:MAG: sulfotransferase [Magnetococcales bacterium]|nr:sulfotransferase [Magnetococcales bacterium]